ncbi:hypothetical protein QCA50_009175 [Cerrena zonata]|uniref:Uncharacterized protein n=1 Tax=Cerrena zonata TaxID=2478898 RepID=A0AAW0G4Z5_9APHY
MDFHPLSQAASTPNIPDNLYEALINQDIIKGIWDSLESWLAAYVYFLYHRGQLLTVQLEPTGPLLRCPTETETKYPHSRIIDPTPHGRSFAPSVPFFIDH